MALRKSQGQGSSSSPQEELLALIDKITPESVFRSKNELEKATQGLFSGHPQQFQLIHEMYERCPQGYAAMRRLILDMAWIYCQQGMQLGDHIPDKRVVRRIMRFSGLYQGLYGLFEQLNPRTVEQISRSGPVDRAQSGG